MSKLGSMKKMEALKERNIIALGFTQSMNNVSNSFLALIYAMRCLGHCQLAKIMAEIFIRRIRLNRLKLITKFILSLVLSVFWITGQAQIGVQVLNKGIGGNTTVDLLGRLDRDVISEQPDLVLLMVGTNDLLNSRKMLSFVEYRKNIIQIIEKLKKSNVELVLMSPPPVDSVYLFQRHDRGKFITPPDEKLEAARDMLEKMSSEYGCHFIDVFSYFRGNGIPEHNKDDIIRNEHNSDSADGVHLTKKGNQLLGSFIFKNLLEYGQLIRGIRIICFGDSLTFGASMKGKGTSTGDTYPAVLKRALERHLEP